MSQGRREWQGRKEAVSRLPEGERCLGIYGFWLPTKTYSSKTTPKNTNSTFIFLLLLSASCSRNLRHSLLSDVKRH